MQSVKNFIRERDADLFETSTMLAEQWLMMVSDNMTPWLSLEMLEKRIEKHIRALMLAEINTPGQLTSLMTDGEAGSVYCLAKVYCRQNNPQGIRSLIQQLDKENEKPILALVHALIQDMPAEPPWLEFIESLTASGRDLDIFIAAEIAGLRRLPVSQKLLGALNRSQDISLSVCRAVGRIMDQKSCSPLRLLLQHHDGAIAAEAALGLMRLHDRESLEICRKLPGSSLPAILIGISGKKNDIDLLTAPGRETSLECLTGLGLLGNIEAVPYLIGRLGDPDIASTAAVALNIICGANLYETTMIKHTFDPDEGFDNELGLESTQEVLRLSQDPNIWEGWWKENRSSFDPARRYRNGQLCSPMGLLDVVQLPDCQGYLRQLFWEELIIRYDIDVQFERTMTVERQTHAISSCYQKLMEKQEQYKHGVWYFGGEQTELIQGL